MRFEYPKAGVLNINREFRAPTFATVTVRVLRPFYGNGKLLQPGTIAKLADPDAADAVALNRAERI